MRVTAPRTRLFLCLVGTALFATTVAAAVTAVPSSVSAFPNQSTLSILVSLTFAPAKSGGTIAITGAPAGVTTIPSTVTYTAGVGATSASTSFAFAVASGTAPGSYVVTLTDTANGAGSTNVVLTVKASSFTTSAAPNPVTLVSGGATQQVVVSTTTDPGFNDPTITYSFSGLPSFIVNDGPKATSSATGYAPVTFTFSANAGATGGTYTGSFTGVSSSGSTRSGSLIVVVQQPDIAASFSSPVLQMCNGQTASDAVQLSPLNGYSGSPALTFTFVPAGITITPSPLPSPKMPPGQTIPFNVAATGASSGIAVLNIRDTAAGIDKNIQLQINIGPSDFTPAVSPIAVNLTAGGSAQTVTGSIAPTTCFASDVTVTATGQPAGMTITPTAGIIAAPGFGAIPISIQASAATQPGTYPITFAFTSGTITKSAIVQVSVAAAPDFILNLNPATLTLQAGTSSTTVASITPVNGFTGTATVTAPASTDVTFSPLTFTLSPGSTQPVTVTVSGSAVPGPRSFTFVATAAGISGTRTATLSLSIGGRPDFSITATPPSLTVRSGETATVSVSAVASSGFTAPISVTSPAIAGLAFTPAVFTLTPGASQQVTITASAAAVVRSPIEAIFTATAAGLNAPHTASVLVTVVPPRPPLLTAASPPALVTGTQSIVVRVGGDFLQQGARFQSSDPTMIVESATVLTPKLADVRITVRPDAPPGPHYLTVTNPDGGVSPAPLVLLVYPPSSIAAPLDVTAAAIVYPARGTIVAPNSALYPRGLLATTGTGTITGTWRFDGAPFDRFIVNAAAGMPVEVRANVPVPTSFAGGHTLEVVIESPRHVISPVVEIVDSTESASRLTLLAPLEGAILRGAGQLFRWSLVPSCSGYDIEVARPGTGVLPDALTPIARFHVANAEWRPTAADLADIGPGIHRWRVRPRCAGETELEPTQWQRFAILPAHVTITLLPVATAANGARVVRWNSDVVGLLYRVEFLSPAGETVFSALTPSTEYTVPRAFPAGTTVRVSAIAPDGAILGTSPTSPVSRRNAREEIQLVQQTLIELGAVEPPDGATISESQPHIAAQWKGGADPDRITLLLDKTDVTQVAARTPTSVTYDSLVALDPGPHEVTLTVAGVVKTWQFTIAPAAAEGAPGTGAAPAEQRDDWVIAPVGSITLVRAANREARAQFSGLTDLNPGPVSNKAAGDISLAHNFRTDKTVQESRNWVGEVGAQQGPGLNEMLRVGFTSPDFFDQAQLLSAGIARGGAQAKVAGRAGIASYYQTVTSHPAGAMTGFFGPVQKLRAASYQIPLSNQWDLRILGLRVNEKAAPGSTGGEGRAFGVFGRYTLGTALNAIVEAARGDFRPDDGSSETRRQGNAMRAGLSGMHGMFNYSMNVHRTQADFINPANRGFTPAGVPDRTGGDMTLGQIIGTSSITLQLRHQQDGTSENLPVPRTRQSGGTLTLTKALTQRVSLMVSGNTTRDRGDEKPEISLPRTERNQSGATGTLSELFGGLNLAETLSRQTLRDHLNNLSDQTITAATLTGGGVVSPYLNLQTMLSGTRSAGSPIVGTTDQYLVSVQPMITIPFLFVSLQPRASYSTSSNDLTASKTTTEQYQGLVVFGPQWFKSLFALQFSADWSRNKLSGQPEPAKFVRRLAATFNLQYRAGAGPAYIAGLLPLQPIPGVAPPNPAASAPGTPR